MVWGARPAYHEAHHVPGRVELTTLLTGRIGKLADEVLISCAKQVRELEVLVPKAKLA
jgi:hypothetical protein